MRSLTAARLAALNHGSVKSPIPGLEAQTVLTKLRNWAAAGIGEIKIGGLRIDAGCGVQMAALSNQTTWDLGRF